MNPLLRLLFLSLLACAALVPPWLGCGGDEGSDDARVESNRVGRFKVKNISMRRGPPELLRTDSATGQAWRKNLMADGVWLAMNEKTGEEPEVGERGRYVFQVVPLRRGAPTLLRTDSVTGKTWRKGFHGGGPWVPLPDKVGQEPRPLIGGGGLPLEDDEELEEES